MYWQQKKDLCLSNLQSSNVPVVKYICHLTRQYYLHMVNFNSVKAGKLMSIDTNNDCHQEYF